MIDAITIAVTHGISFTQENDGWYWGDTESDILNGPFATKDDAACDFISGADNLGEDDE